MLEFLAGIVIDGGLQAAGWGVLKVITLGRYRGFKPENILLEGTVGFAVLCLVGYGIYHWVFS